jgi:hypothetical protein
MSLVAGCDSRSKIVPIAGKVVIDGKPLDRGTIVVYPKGYRIAQGRIDKQGNFRLTTHKMYDGCPLGEHPITVESTDGGDTKIKFFIPERYSKLETSDVKVNIEGPKDDLVITLTWKGDKNSDPYIVRQ